MVKTGQPLGAGVNDRVEYIIIADNGDVLVSGRFTEAGGAGSETGRPLGWPELA